MSRVQSSAECSDRNESAAGAGRIEMAGGASHPEMGECRAAFRANILRNASWLMSLAIGVAVGGVLLGYMIHQDGLWPQDLGITIVQLLMAADVVICSVLLVRAIRKANCDLLIFDKGLIARRGKQLEKIQWDDIEAVFEEVTVITYNQGAATQIRHKLRIRLRDQRQTRLDLSSFPESEQISAAIADATVPRLLHEAQVKLSAGQLVEFGFVNISGAGLERPGDVSGTAALNWRDVAEFTIDDGLLTIKSLKGWKPWAWKAVEQIPNLRVLITLLERYTTDALMPAGEKQSPLAELAAH